MSVRKSSYFLVHDETGQRYPIRAGVIIGRGSADIVFSKDTKLTNQHCEVMPAENGLAVRDLHSVNGTFIDGKKLQSDKGYLLKLGSELTVGAQVFHLQTVSLTKNLRRRRKKARNKNGESYTQVFLILVLALGIIFWQKGNISFDRGGEVTLSQRQLADIFDDYQEMMLSLERQTAPPQDIARRIQGQILGRLSAVSRRWPEFQPRESERAQFQAENHFATALASHAKNLVLYITTADNKYLDEVDQFTDQLEQAVSEVRSLPSGSQFPNFVQSPLQLVEREMRQSLRAYKNLGASVERKEVTAKEMGEKIRTQLMPQMKAVYARMGAIAPHNDFERRKVLLEQKLMTAFIGQVKSMSLVVDSGDPKYTAEVDHWTHQIEKLNSELKAEVGLGRTPASKPK